MMLDYIGFYREPADPGTVQQLKEMALMKCPVCGKFMRYDAYYARWQCADTFCPGQVTPERSTGGKATDNTSIREALKKLIEEDEDAQKDKPAADPDKG